MIKVAHINGWIRVFGSLPYGGEGCETNYLLYVDDSLVFCEAEVGLDQAFEGHSDYF